MPDRPPHSHPTRLPAGRHNTAVAASTAYATPDDIRLSAPAVRAGTGGGHGWVRRRRHGLAVVALLPGLTLLVPGCGWGQIPPGEEPYSRDTPLIPLSRGAAATMPTPVDPPSPPPAAPDNVDETPQVDPPPAPVDGGSPAGADTVGGRAPATGSATIEPLLSWPFLKINLAEGYVDVEGVVGTDRGWLEQIACSLGTRTHESVVIVLARPSHIHAALLLMGLEPGRPGAWEAVEELPPADGAPRAIRSAVASGAGGGGAEGAPADTPGAGGAVDTGGRSDAAPSVPVPSPEPEVVVPTGDGDAATLMAYRRRPPTGPHVRVTVRYRQSDGAWSPEQPVGDWVRDHVTGETLPDLPWHFAGSIFVDDFEGRRVYAADVTGSVVGLVTFGDEVFGWPEVIPDRVAVRAPEWLAYTEVMPAPDTPVILRLRPVAEPGATEAGGAGDGAAGLR